MFCWHSLLFYIYIVHYSLLLILVLSNLKHILTPSHFQLLWDQEIVFIPALLFNLSFHWYMYSKPPRPNVTGRNVGYTGNHVPLLSISQKQSHSPCAINERNMIELSKMESACERTVRATYLISFLWLLLHNFQYCFLSCSLTSYLQPLVWWTDSTIV